VVNYIKEGEIRRETTGFGKPNVIGDLEPGRSCRTTPVQP
jgi:hypothetical protein